MKFSKLFENKDIIYLSTDMKEYADQAYNLVQKYLDLQQLEGISFEHLYKNLEIEPVTIFKRRVFHEDFETPHKINMIISSKSEKNIIRFDGEFDFGNMDKIYISIMSPKQMKDFSEPAIKKDFIDRVRHELIHALDPINNDTVTRKQYKVEDKIKSTTNYKDYIALPWEIKANMSSMAERNIEDMIRKSWDYAKIKKEIYGWVPKISHSNYHKEQDYFNDKNFWKGYKEMMEKILEKRLKE